MNFRNTQRREFLKSVSFGGLLIAADPVVLFAKQKPVQYDLPSIHLVCEKLDVSVVGNAMFTVNSDWIFWRRPGTVLLCGFHAQRRSDLKWELTLDFRYSNRGFVWCYSVKGEQFTVWDLYKRTQFGKLLSLGKQVTKISVLR